MTPERNKNTKVELLLSVITLSIGLLLLIYMILVEDEPGALPLVLILGGATWYFYIRFKTYSASN